MVDFYGKLVGNLPCMDPICLNEAGEKAKNTSFMSLTSDLDSGSQSRMSRQQSHNGDTFPKMFLSQKSGHFSWFLMVP